MNKIKLLSALILTLFLSGCSKDDDSDPVPAANINGEWKLFNVSNTSGIDDDFAPGVIKWTFNSNTNTVEVVNNNTDDTLESILPSGDYAYSLETNTSGTVCSQNFFIDSIDFGCYNLTATQLTIGNGDGIIIKLVR